MLPRSIALPWYGPHYTLFADTCSQEPCGNCYSSVNPPHISASLHARIYHPPNITLSAVPPTTYLITISKEGCFHKGGIDCIYNLNIRLACQRDPMHCQLTVSFSLRGAGTLHLVEGQHSNRLQWY